MDKSRVKRRITPSRRDPSDVKIPSYHPPRAKFPKKEGPERQSLLHDPDCISLRNSLIDSNSDLTVVPNSDLDKLSAHLKEYSAWCGLKRLYSKAQQADDLNERIRVETISRISTKEHAAADLQELEDARKLIQMQFEEELKEFDEETEEKMERILLSQQHKMETFEAKWRDEMPRKYRHPSAKLLNMIASERQYAKQGKYKEAASMQEAVDKLTAIEASAAQAKLNSDYKEARAKLDAKFKDEVELFNQTRTHLKEVTLEKQRAEFESLENRRIVVEMKASKPEVVQKEEKLDGSTARIRRKYAELENSLLPVLAPPNNEDALMGEEERLKQKQARSRQIRKRLSEREQAAEDVMISTSSTVGSVVDRTVSRASSGRTRTYRTDAQMRESSRLRK